MRHLWQTLTRRRSLRDPWARQALRQGGGQRSGVALLVVMTTVLILTVLVTDLAYTARVRFLVTAHRVDRQQAWWLARSGVEIYELLILADREMGDALSQFGLDELGIDNLLEMIPQINTGLLTMLMATDNGSDLEGDEDELKAQATAALEGTEAVSEEVREKAIEEGGGLFSERSWLDMPGDFAAEVQLEDCRINVNLLRSATTATLEESPTYQLMLGRLAGDENEIWLRERDLTARDLIANLTDWVDADSTRAGNRGGYEDSDYQNQVPPYHAKNGAFETMDEIRLVEGWQDEVYDRFAEQFTIYGSGKLNISCEDDQIDWAILHSSFVESPPVNDQSAQDYIELINEQRMLGFLKTPKEYVAFLRQIGVEPTRELESMLTNKTSVYRIISTGLVGSSAVTMTQVSMFDSRGRNTMLYSRVE